jgi:hypothetical protein
MDARSARTTVNENQIQQAIRIALGDEPDLVLWRNNTGSAEAWDPSSGTTRVHKFGLAVGSADLVGILRPGRFFALEVKQTRGRVSPEQEAWLALVRRMGGFAAVVRSVDEAKAALARARNGASE